MMVLKRKQIVVLSLILMIVVAGYLQYSYNKSGMSVNDSDDISVSEFDDETERLGEALYVDNTMVLDDEKKDDKKEEKREEDKKEKSKQENKAVQASKEANEFFAQAKMDKDVTRARDREELEKITNDENATEEQKAQAYEKMLTLLDNSDKEMRIETLIKNKGFSDVVVFFGDDGSVDVVVKAPSISSVEVAQIAEIASRQAGVDISDVHVSNKF
ncbi:MAG TPA: SpoIIIAH-like family protein [Acetivibrio sp.]|uniref:SpoIIIAH-like family protein n=1 Tax=Acetivibrio sp. TaxID=1872092 RepID=UPI002C894424|nr:SpoIIIAH-like family protein [Acetivibrio sp.]HOM01344.1 SpoIIIAH-like family protein [Acetivibrio sp.]